MKKSIFTAIVFALSTFLYAEVPDLLKEEFGDKTAVFFDAQEFSKNYSDIKMLNKTAEKIETIIYAYNPKNEKKTTKPIGWIKLGTIKVSDYNENRSIIKQLKYTLSSLKDFRYFAYTTSKTNLETTYELSFNNEILQIQADYLKAIKPLASLESKPIYDKNPKNKKEILGVKAEFSFRNVSKKQIKSVILTMSAYDKGFISRTINGDEEISVKIDETISDGQKYKAETRAVWSDTAIDKISISKVKIVYSDSSEIEY